VIAKKKVFFKPERETYMANLAAKYHKDVDKLIDIREKLKANNREYRSLKAKQQKVLKDTVLFDGSNASSASAGSESD
jgi:hypothetical protein